MLHSIAVVGMNGYQTSPVALTLSDLEGQFSCLKPFQLPQETLHFFLCLYMLVEEHMRVPRPFSLTQVLKAVFTQFEGAY